jgi:hypothetical protein
MPEPTAAEVVRKLRFALMPGSLHCISPEVVPSQCPVTQDVGDRAPVLDKAPADK